MFFLEVATILQKQMFLAKECNRHVLKHTDCKHLNFDEIPTNVRQNRYEKLRT